MRLFIVSLLGAIASVSASERPFNIFLDKPPTLNESFGAALQTLFTGEFTPTGGHNRARSMRTLMREYTLEDLRAGRSISGVDISRLPRQQQWELAQKYNEYMRLCEHLDLDRFQLERAHIMDYLSMETLPVSDRLYYTKMLQLLSVAVTTPEIAETVVMMTTTADHAQEIFSCFLAFHMQGGISDTQMESIRIKYEERPEIAGRKERILASCDFVSTPMSCTTACYNIDGLLKGGSIRVPDFSTDIDWCEMTQYINASLAKSALLVDESESISWEQWGALNTQAIEQIMRPLIAVYGAARGSGDALIGPIVDTAHSVCNIVIESCAHHFGVEVDTPMHDALEDWIEKSRALYESDPYQAGYNLGGSLMKVALPFIKGSTTSQKTRLASYKRTLSVCRTAQSSSQAACVII